jgi:hypothetical protein
MEDSRQGLSPSLEYRLPPILMDEGYPTMPRDKTIVPPSSLVPRNSDSSSP